MTKECDISHVLKEDVPIYQHDGFSLFDCQDPNAKQSGNALLNQGQIIPTLSHIRPVNTRPADQKHLNHYPEIMEWVIKKYNEQYEKWVPWVEDKYLAWFGENKTSYVAKGAFHCAFEMLEILENASSP